MPSSDRTGAIRLVRNPQQVIGAGQHRSGWPYAFAHLQPLAADQGILLDDFVEQRFCYDPDPAPHREPWIGIFHHPPHPPEFTNHNERLSVLFQKPAWQESAQYLRGAIALSEHLAGYLADVLKTHVEAVKHPSEIPDQLWSPEAYLSNRHKWLLQVGWYLRNTRAIFQVPALEHHRKVRLWPPHRGPLHWVRDYDDRVARYWRENGERVEWGNVTDYPIVGPARYDQLFACQVVLTEIFAASANNVIIECIARQTPIVVNRHAAVVEYLSPDYPLYFDDIRQVPELLAPERVIAAHEHLAKMDKSWLSGDVFRQNISAALHSIIAN